MKKLLPLCLILGLLGCGKSDSQPASGVGASPAPEVTPPPPVSCPDFTGEWLCSDSSGKNQWNESIVTAGNVYEITFGKSSPNEKKNSYVADGRVYKIIDPSIATIIVDKIVKKMIQLLPNGKITKALDLTMELVIQIEKTFKVNASLACGDNTLNRSWTFAGSLTHPATMTVDGSGQIYTSERLVGRERQVKITGNGRFSYTPSKILSLVVKSLKDDTVDYADTAVCRKTK